MREFLFRFYWKLEKIFFPALRSSQYFYHDELCRLIPDRCSWLELGCGFHMFGSWMTREERELARRAVRLVGLDLDWEGLAKNQIVSERVFGDAQRLPFADKTFDVVTADMVVEHLEDPDRVLREVYRVLRPEGIFVYHTPNSRSVLIRLASRMPQWLKVILANLLEGRKEEDVFPTHYRMNTLEAIEQRAISNGFDVVRASAVSSGAVTAMLGPFAIVELLYLRLLEHAPFARYRGNLIAVIRRGVRQ